MTDMRWETSAGYLGVMRPELMAFGHDGGFLIQDTYRKLLTTGYGVGVLESLSKDPRVLSLIGKQVYQSGPYAEFSLEDLAKWHLWRINNDGEELARKVLNRYLDEEKVVSFVAVWVSGIEIDSMVTLFGGYFLIPYHEMPEIHDKYYAPLFQESIAFASDRVAVVKWFSAPKVQEGDIPFSSDAMHEMQSLMTVVQTLALLPNSRVSARYAATYVPESTPFGVFRSFFSSSGLSDGLPDSPSNRTALGAYCDNGYLEQAFTALESQPPAKKDKWGRILQRLSRAKRYRSYADRVLELGIILEMLLLDDSDSGELRFRLSLRGAWLIGKDAEDRRNIFRALMKLYDYRSKAAHTGEVSKGEYLAKHIEEYERIAERICYHILVNGHPDWTELVLGCALDQCEPALLEDVAV